MSKAPKDEISANRSSNEIITEFFSKYHSGEEPIELLDEVVQTIFNDPELEHRDFHLASILYANVKDPSPEFIAKLVRAVLKVDHFNLDNRHSVQNEGEQKTITVAGSGKKGFKTINISTPSAIVASCLGAKTIKVGSRSTSSMTGSFDFFEMLGGQAMDAQKTLQSVEALNFGLVSIENLIPKFDALYGRRALAPTTLSYALAGVVTPIKTDAIYYGLSMPNIKASIHALHQLGYSEAMVVNTTDDHVRYIDEAGLFQKNSLVFGRVKPEKTDLEMGDPARMAGLEQRYTTDCILQGASKDENIKIAVKILQGRGENPKSEIIALNAACMLVLANASEDYREAFKNCLKTIKTGEPYEKLKAVIQFSGGEFNANKF